MKFNSIEQEEVYKKAMNHVFKAAAFDIDGTLADFRRMKIPSYLLHKLAEFPPEFPLAICSGRDLEKIKFKISEIHKLTQQYLRKSDFFIISENGGASHHYDFKTDKTKKIFKTEWPKGKINKEALAQKIQEVLHRFIIVKVRDLTLIVHFPSFFYTFPSIIQKMSYKTRNKIERFFIKEGLDKDFCVQDSGIGCIIFPKESGKGKAINKLSKYLKIAHSDFLLVGDKPREGGNDEEFLNGDYGVSFSVGELTKNIYPLPVFDKNKRIVKGPFATYSLLSQIKFKTML